MRSLNRLTLIGNVGAEPEMRTTSSGTKLTRLSLATNRRWTDSVGETQERTDWHRLTCWGKLAEIADEFVSKGDQLYVEGRVEYGSYDRDGESVPTVEIHVFELLMLGAGDRGGAPRRRDQRVPQPDMDL